MYIIQLRITGPIELGEGFGKVVHSNLGKKVSKVIYKETRRVSCDGVFVKWSTLGSITVNSSSSFIIYFEHIQHSDLSM